jgi:hypothetical protein
MSLVKSPVISGTTSGVPDRFNQSGKPESPRESRSIPQGRAERRAPFCCVNGRMWFFVCLYIFQRNEVLVFCVIKMPYEKAFQMLRGDKCTTL